MLYRLHQITKKLMRSSKTAVMQGKILEKYVNETYFKENYFKYISSSCMNRRCTIVRI